MSHDPVPCVTGALGVPCPCPDVTGALGVPCFLCHRGSGCHNSLSPVSQGLWVSPIPLCHTISECLLSLSRVTPSLAVPCVPFSSQHRALPLQSPAAAPPVPRRHLTAPAAGGVCWATFPQAQPRESALGVGTGNGKWELGIGDTESSLSQHLHPQQSRAQGMPRRLLSSSQSHKSSSQLPRGRKILLSVPGGSSQLLCL